MNRELRERREETFDLLVVKNIPYGRVVERIADKYDLTESGVKSDISRMDDWLPDIVDDAGQYRNAGVLLKEVADNRARMHQMAMGAQRDKERMEELQIREQIEKSVELEVALAQSLGELEREPESYEFDVDGEFATSAMDVVFVDEENDELVDDLRADDAVDDDTRN